MTEGKLKSTCVSPGRDPMPGSFETTITPSCVLTAFLAAIPESTMFQRLRKEYTYLPTTSSKNTLVALELILSVYIYHYSVNTTPCTKNEEYII